MSFILDALKKSEAERQRRAGPALLEMRVVRPQRRFPVWILVGLGTLLIANLLLILWFFMRPPAAEPVAAAIAPALPAAPSSQPPQQPVVAIASNEAPFVVAGEDPTPVVSRLPRYEDMPAEMPKLQLDMHVYSPKPSERYALINMHKVREGDTTAEGMKVLTITSDGVELRYRDNDFLLGRE